VRADATMEEGWFYEGAGIYRHVWLTKTAALHMAENGVCVQPRNEGLTTDGLSAQNAAVATSVTLINQQHQGNSSQERHAGTIFLRQNILDSAGNIVATATTRAPEPAPGETTDIPTSLSLPKPHLWSTTNPYLYTLTTTVLENNSAMDSCATTFGFRTIRWDPDAGFLVIAIHIGLKGINDHQDH